MKKALLVSILGLSASFLSADILITEILYNPAGADTTGTPVTFTQEWVEIYNTGPSAVDLSSWKLRDEDANSANWDTLSGILQPGQAGIITMSSQAEFEASWPTAVGALVITVPGWGSIANSAVAGNEVLSILDDLDNTVDVADYETGSNFWPAGQNGASIYLLPGFIDTVSNDNGANWAAAALGVDGAITSLLAGSFEGGSVASPGVVVVVPEPSAYVLLLGFGGLAFVAWRRRR